MTTIILYIIAQTFCVISSTIKSVALIRGTKMTAVLLNTIHYVINATVTYLVGRSTALDIITILITCAITNLLGVWIGLTVSDKVRKDRLWRISATVKAEYYDNLIFSLKKANIKFVTFETDWDRIKLIDVFSFNREQSKIIRTIFEANKVKYTISDANYNLA